MLDALVKNSGLDRVLDATISVDANKIFKPSPDAYTLIESTLHIPPHEVLFISSNPWDACGAKAFGLNVAWIERVTPEAMALACIESAISSRRSRCSRRSAPRWTSSGSSPTIASMRSPNCPTWWLPKGPEHEP